MRWKNANSDGDALVTKGCQSRNRRESHSLRKTEIMRGQDITETIAGSATPTGFLASNTTVMKRLRNCNGTREGAIEVMEGSIAIANHRVLPNNHDGEIGTLPSTTQ